MSDDVTFICRGQKVTPLSYQLAVDWSSVHDSPISLLTLFQSLLWMQFAVHCVNPAHVDTMNV